MNCRPLKFPKMGTILVLGATTVLFAGNPVRAQSNTAQDVRSGQNSSTSRVAVFDQFMDSHREIADQLRRDPSLIDNHQFVQGHPELQSFLKDHPGIESDFRQNPNAFMHAEERYDNRENGGDREALRRDYAEFDRFMDSHREIAEQLRKDPSLVDNRQFVQNHPALDTFLRDHTGVREEIRQDPNAFMHAEQRFDTRQDSRNANGFDRDGDADGRDRDANTPDRDGGARDRADANGGVRDQDRYPANGASRDRDRDSAQFHEFLNSHQEIAEQVRKNPSLMNNEGFLKDHPALQSYYQQNPGVRQEITENHEAFLRQDNERYSNQNGAYQSATHDHMASFGGFLVTHPDIARQVSEKPEVVKDHQFVDNHAELKTYLNANPQVRDELVADPDNFVKGAQQMGNGGANGTTKSTTGTPAASTPGTSSPTPPAPVPNHDPKNKQQ